jgi:hypothetical protein
MASAQVLLQRFYYVASLRHHGIMVLAPASRPTDFVRVEDGNGMRVFGVKDGGAAAKDARNHQRV